MKHVLFVIVTIAMIVALTMYAFAAESINVSHLHKHSPCNELTVEKNYYIANDDSFFVIKKGGEYALWTYDKLSYDMLHELELGINEFVANGCEDCESCGAIGKKISDDNVQYKYGADVTLEIDGEAIYIKPMFNSNSYHIEFSDHNAWSLIYLGQYWTENIEDEVDPGTDDMIDEPTVDDKTDKHITEYFWEITD